MLPALQPGGTSFDALSSIAATPSGTAFLLAWTDVTAEGTAQVASQGFATVVHVGPTGTSAVPPFAAPSFGQAVFDGDDFAVVGNPLRDPPCLPGDGTSQLALQRVGVGGRLGLAAALATLPSCAWATSAVSTPRGIAVAWFHSESTPVAGAVLLAPDGSIEESAAFGLFSGSDGIPVARRPQASPCCRASSSLRTTVRSPRSAGSERCRGARRLRSS